MALPASPEPTAPPELTILYFAWLRERIGTGREKVTLPDGVASVAELAAWLGRRSPGHAAAFANARVIRCAVNHEFARPETPVVPGDEVAFFPPVTGG